MLAGRRGLVLGVANKRSLALACARSCAERGARLSFAVQSERFADTTRELAVQLPGQGAQPPVHLCDVSRDEDLERLAAKLKVEWGQIDFVVHSIAFADPEELRARFHRTSRKGFAQALDVSAYSLVAVAQALQPILSKDASIVTLSYLGGERVVPNYNVMGAAKAALDSCVRYLAWDLGPQGVRVNSVLPGPIRTVSAAAISDFGKMLEHVEQVAPLRRNVTADEVGDVVAFLVSSMARGVTGQMIHVDSGYSVMGVTTVAEGPGKP
jgi:enoyl-[acyl-carrier protein] reductase I